MRDLTRLFNANYNAFPGGIYLDIHAVVCAQLRCHTRLGDVNHLTRHFVIQSQHDLHLQSANQYLDAPFHLLPNGLTYRVVPSPRVRKKSKRKGQPQPPLSHRVLARTKWLQWEGRVLDKLATTVQPADLRRYPPGMLSLVAGHG